MSGDRSRAGRRWPAALLGGLLMLAASACQRGLDDARCPCAPGWTCCTATNRCLPQAEALMCGGGGDGQAGSGVAGGGGAGAPGNSGGAAGGQGGRGGAGGRGGQGAVAGAGGQAGAAGQGGAGNQAGAGNQGGAGGQGGRGGGAGGMGGAAGGGPDNPPPNVPGLCTSEGWCWTHPLPTGDRFTQAFGIGADEVWVVGTAGTVVRFHQDGTWSPVPSPMASVYTLWGLSSSDVWAGGAQGVFRWNGQSWAASPIGTGPSSRAVYAMWGCGPEDVWAVGGALGHWSGGVWSYPTLPASNAFIPLFKTVWGSACNDVWAGGTVTATGAGAIIHWDGANWSPSADIPSDTLVGTGAQSVWSVARGSLSAWDGHLWSPSPWSQAVWNLFPAGAAQIGILDDTHAVTLSPTLTPVPLGPAPADVTSIFGRTAADLWGVAGPGVVVRRQGDGWNSVLSPWSLSTGTGTRVTGSSGTDLWAAVGGALLQGDGSKWHTALTPAQTGGTIADVWASSAKDVRVLGGDGVIHHWNGTVWTADSPPPASGGNSALRAISGSGAQDVWVLRGGDTVLHWGGTWVSRQPLQLANLVDVWAGGPDEAWVVGDGVGHWSGGDWVPVQLPAQVAGIPFRAVDGLAGAVFFLAGTNVLRASEDGRSLSVVASFSAPVSALHVAAANDVWFLVQEPGLTRVYHATGPTPADLGMSSVAPGGMNDIWSAPDGTLWLTGEGGAVLKRLPR